MTESQALDALRAARARTADLCRQLGVSRPVLNAPMPDEAGPELVAAVCEAGGLGVLSLAGLEADAARERIAALRALTARPFALHLELPGKRVRGDNLARARQLAEGLAALFADLGLPDPTGPEGEALYDLTGEARLRRFEAGFAVALEARPAAVITTFGGLREPEADALRDARILNIGTATTLREAKVLRAAHCDAIVVQGLEAAGPRSCFEDSDYDGVGLASLLPAAARATKLPIIAAGGVATPEQALGLTLMGASAVMMGTAFLTVKEARVTEYQRRAATWATPKHLVLSRIHSGRLSRTLHSPLHDALESYGSYLPDWPAQVGMMAALQARARETGREDLEAVPLGQSVGRSAAVSAAALVEAVSAALV